MLLDSQDARVLCYLIHRCACFVLLDSQGARVLSCSVCHLTGVGLILTGEKRSTHR